MIARIGLSLPLSLAEVQRRAAKVICRGADAIIQSATGSGKTLAFIIPLLARLKYPPDAYPEDFRVKLPYAPISSCCTTPLPYMGLSCTCPECWKIITSCGNNPGTLQLWLRLIVFDEPDLAAAGPTISHRGAHA